MSRITRDFILEKTNKLRQKYHESESGKDNKKSSIKSWIESIKSTAANTDTVNINIKKKSSHSSH